MRPGGKDGFGYEIEFGTQLTTGTLTIGTWYRIDEKASSGSVLPATLELGEGFIAHAADILGSGDKVTPMTLTKLDYMTDDEDSSSVNKYEDTVQKDATRSYQQGNKPETTGSISGMYETNSDAMERIENHFKIIIKDDGAGGITRKAIDGETIHLMISRRETTEVGEVAIWEYKPVIVDQLSQGKPMDGVQPFKFNYTVNGKYKPFVYKKTIAA